MKLAAAKYIPAVVLPDDDALITEMRDLLREAAESGDAQAKLFLGGTFEPWVIERLAERVKS